MRTTTTLTVASVTVVALAGAGVAAMKVVGGGAVSASSAMPAVARLAAPAPPPAQLVVAREDAQGQVPWDQPLRLIAEHGRITSVSITSAEGQPLAGAPTPDGSEWRSATTLVPLETYRADVSYADLAQKVHHETLKVSVADSEKHLRATLSPAGGDVVGVGEPAIVYLSRWVPESERAAVEQHLTVTTSPAVDGSWHWVNGQEIHWRPQEYWAPGTDVRFGVDLHHVYVGDGVWGDPQAHTAHFAIGARHVSTVDVKAHTMDVYNGSTLVKHFKISAGSPKYPTMNGVHIALEKQPVVVMDSQTVGIPRNSPDGYYEKVNWDVRISNGGAFVHSAPWSVRDQGVLNVSHGCVNLAPADAEWFFNFSRRGDVVDIVNSVRPVDTSDPGTADWNMSWSQWVAGSALH